MDDLLTEALIKVINHLGACRLQPNAYDRVVADHIDTAYDEAVESLLRLRAPQAVE